jgi:hypothetical protein
MLETGNVKPGEARGVRGVPDRFEVSRKDPEIFGRKK